MKNIHYIIFALLNFAALSCFAQDAKSIAQKAYDRDDGKDSWAEVEMKLTDEDGNDKVRKVIMASRDFGELSRRYIKFTSPAAIDGTSFLSVEKFEDRDDQFLYLPGVGRVRRIASDQKDRSFVNTDFTYEDMERRKVERDNHKLAGSENLSGRDCWVLERESVDPEDSQYSKVVSWIAKDTYLVLKSEMYLDGKIIKRFLAGEIKKIDGIWTIMDVTMHDLRNQHKTTNKILTIRYNKGVPEEVFTQKYLEKDK